MVHSIKLADLAGHRSHSIHQAYCTRFLLMRHLLLPRRLSSPVFHQGHSNLALASTNNRFPVNRLSLLYPASSCTYRIIISSSKEPSSSASATDKLDFTKAINNNAAYKVRSHDTHYKIHVPEIRSRLSATGVQDAADDKAPLRVALLGSSSLERFKITGERLRIVLLGDSMFERFKRTGESHISA